jgi:hypothetical protein
MVTTLTLTTKGGALDRSDECDSSVSQYLGDRLVELIEVVVLFEMNSGSLA